MTGAYDHPEYYEIAFSYQQVERQVDFFDEVADRFFKGKVRRFLDIGCGPSPQLREIVRRGYEAVGLDINANMLRYLRQKASEEGIEIETIQADMRDFKLKKKCDFAFILSGSLYVNSNDEFLRHLDCVSGALNDYGIYLLENVSLELKPFSREEWTVKRDEIFVRTVFEAKLIDPIRQVSQERLILYVNKHGKRSKFVSTLRMKDFSPQEFKSLVELNGKFEFLGFFKHLSLAPLRKLEKNNIVLLRKRPSEHSLSLPH